MDANGETAVAVAVGKVRATRLASPGYIEREMQTHVVHGAVGGSRISLSVGSEAASSSPLLPHAHIHGQTERGSGEWRRALPLTDPATHGGREERRGGGTPFLAPSLSFFLLARDCRGAPRTSCSLGRLSTSHLAINAHKQIADNGHARSSTVFSQAATGSPTEPGCGTLAFDHAGRRVARNFHDNVAREASYVRAVYRKYDDCHGGHGGSGGPSRPLLLPLPLPLPRPPRRNLRARGRPSHHASSSPRPRPPAIATPSQRRLALMNR